MSSRSRRFLPFFAVCVALQGCTLLAAPFTPAILGGAQLAIKGAELQKEIRKADARQAVFQSFEETWDASFTALLDLDIQIIASQKIPQEEGGVIDCSAGKTKIRVALVKITDKITEIGIRAHHDEALAQLIVRTIARKAEKRDNG